MAGRYKKKKKRPASSGPPRTEEPAVPPLPMNKRVSNRDKALEQAQKLSSKGLDDQAREALKRAEYWQAKIEER
jgi:hypothetical protein